MLRAYNAQQAIERATETAPHAVFIDRSLPDSSGLELCRTLLEHERFSSATPVLLVTPGPVSHEQRVEALRAGAWELVTFPIDAEELLLRLDRYIRAKVEVDRAREDALVDPQTGFYSWHGTMRRIRELGAAAERFGRPIACIVVTTGGDGVSKAELGDEVVGQVARMLQGETRRSDVLGRIGPSDFAVIVPDTSPEGAEKLARRLRRRAEGNGERPVFAARTGVYGLANVAGAEFNPLDLVNRATQASRTPPTERN